MPCKVTSGVTSTVTLCRSKLYLADEVEDDERPAVLLPQRLKVAERVFVRRVDPLRSSSFK